MKIIIILIMFSITACASAPNQQVLANADYGIFPEDYERAVQNYMSGLLKDPESAHYQYLNAPKKGWNAAGGGLFGYAICARINAKNSFGGYVGAKLNYFMIRNGAVIVHLGGGSDYSVASAKGACSHFI